MNINEEHNYSLLCKKKDKDSDEKPIRLIQFGEDGKEIIKKELKIKSEEELSEYLSSLKNPYAIKEGKIIDLNIDSGKAFFYNDFDLSDIYENIDYLDLLEDYKLLYKDFIDFFEIGRK